ncbi:MAG TPA: EVE domain-containing protein [Firmicutes bacterium]|nr:EVE domain-containing protein [Bacillota bacterium]
MNYWLLKTEPEDYSFADLMRNGRDMWDGVRNHTAQRHLRSMQPGDLAFIYHTGKERAIVGIAEVMTLAYPDPTADDPKWQAVDVAARDPLPRPVTLQEIKSWPELAQWELVRLPRLSVMPVPEQAWRMVMEAATDGARS